MHMLLYAVTRTRAHMHAQTHRQLTQSISLPTPKADLDNKISRHICSKFSNNIGIEHWTD